MMGSKIERVRNRFHVLQRLANKSVRFELERSHWSSLRVGGNIDFKPRWLARGTCLWNQTRAAVLRISNSVPGDNLFISRCGRAVEDDCTILSFRFRWGDVLRGGKISLEFERLVTEVSSIALSLYRALLVKKRIYVHRRSKFVPERRLAWVDYIKRSLEEYFQILVIDRR